MSADYDLLKALDVRVRHVADLDEEALYVVDVKLLLLDIELPEDRVKQAIDGVLPSLWEAS